MTESLATEPLYVTHAGGKVHIAACPHLFQDSKLAPATPEQVEENGLCTHCEKEIRGEGRKYFDDLEDAFRHFGHRTDQARRLIREALDGVQHDKVWIPASESYIALGDDGTGTAWIGKGYVQVKGRPVVELPWFQERGDGGGTSRDEARGQLCEVHFVERSVVGTCEMCE
jgi:hypothetical protein